MLDRLLIGFQAVCLPNSYIINIEILVVQVEIKLVNFENSDYYPYLQFD